jgi:hypothetical protein
VQHGREMAELVTKSYEAIAYGFTSAKPNPVVGKVLLAVACVLILAAAIYGICSVAIRSSSIAPRTAESNVALAMKNQISRLDFLAASYDGQKSLYSDLLKNVDIKQRYLVNLCPLTASIGGYIGPMKNGVFNASYYLKQALRAGIRSFVLPISVYYDDNKMPPNWPKSGKPAIVCRDNNGVIQSLNGFTINDFCKNLLQYMSTNQSQADEPILLFLDGVQGYIPDPIKSEKAYVLFMNDIAKELSPIQPFHLSTIKNYGSAVGGKAQNNILTQIILEDLKRRIIVFTNFNVDIETKGEYTSITPKLYNYANFVYKPVVSTTSASKSPSSSYSIHLGDVKGNQVDWTQESRIVWNATLLDANTGVPDPSTVDSVTKIGIQTIPIPFLFNESPEVLAIYKQWDGYAWRLKPDAARYTKPPEVKPMKPTTALNARVNNALQPGQLEIK